MADAAPESMSVLLIDDERDIRDLARMILEMNGLVVYEAVDGADGLKQYGELAAPPVPTVVVVDNRMPGMNGVQVAEQMLAINPGQVIVLFSAYLDADTEAAAAAVGVRRCVSKTEIKRLPDIVRGLVAVA